MLFWCVVSFSNVAPLVLPADIQAALYQTSHSPDSLSEQALVGSSISPASRANPVPVSFPAKALKELLEVIRQQTDEDFLAHRRGTLTARRLALTIDHLLLALIEFAGLQPEGICIVATGGYGRGMLAPYSDIDLLLFHRPQQVPDVSKFIALLWDTGLKIGFVARSSDELPSDHTAITAFLDARLLWGDEVVFEAVNRFFYRRFDQELFVEQKQQERLKRQEKYDFTSGLVEPDVKDGIGALRDIDYIRWQEKCRNKSMRGKVPNLLNNKEQKTLAKAEKLFWTIRVGLHLLNHGGSNRLNFSIQQEMATLLRYRGTIEQQEAARFMKHYHQLARQVQRIADNLLLETEAHYPQNDQEFFNILCYPQNGAALLKTMHQHDKLAAFIPDMQRLTGLMQFDMYHKYTVDVHTLRAIEMMHRIKTGEIGYDFATNLCAQTPYWRVLCLAIFCHDLAKGLGGDHSIKGMELAQQYGEKFGLNEDDITLARWLVEHHLLLTFNAFRRDVNDPYVVQKFAAEVKTVERLRALFILTTADVIATNPQLLNGWKKELLEQLYSTTKEHLLNAAPQQLSPERVKHPILKQLPYEWFLAFDKDQQQQQLELLKQPRPAIHTRINTQAEVGVVTIVCDDKIGLFASITDSMRQAGLNIVEARLFTLTIDNKNVALDIFTIQDSHHKIPHQDHLNRLGTQLETVLQQDTAQAVIPSKVTENNLLPIKPTSVQFDTKGSRRYLIIEVTALDRQGLLADCAAILRDLQLSVFRARINTQPATAYGRQVIDTFYVTDNTGKKITNKRVLASIEKAFKNL